MAVPVIGRQVLALVNGLDRSGRKVQVAGRRINKPVGVLVSGSGFPDIIGRVRKGAFIKEQFPEYNIILKFRSNLSYIVHSERNKCQVTQIDQNPSLLEIFSEA